MEWAAAHLSSTLLQKLMDLLDLLAHRDPSLI